MTRDTEGSLAHVVSFVLRAGVVLASIVGVAAEGFNLALHGGDREAFRHFREEDGPDRHVGPIFRDAVHLDSRALMMVAILLLLLTPIARVAVSLVGFVRERDRVYVAVTSVVLLTLLGSLLLGGRAE